MRFPAYDEYKDSGVEWLGDIPISWTPKRLKHVSPFIAVGIVVNPSSYVNDDGLPFIYGGDIREGIIDCNNSRRISRESSDANAKTKLEAGDVLTVRVGAPGVTAVVPKECEGGNCASVMLVRKGEFDSRWLCYLMNTPVVRNQVEVVQYGAAQKQFNIEHAVNFWLPVSDLDEQKAIASFLDAETSKIDGLVTEQRRLIELLKEKRQAVISHAVTKGLNPNAPMKPSGIQWLGDVPEHWTVSRIKYECQYESGHTPSKSNEAYWIEDDCNIPWVSLNDTKTIDANDFIDDTATKISEVGMANSSAHLIDEGAVVFTRDGARVGLSAITTKTMCVSQHIIAWVCGPKVSNHFLLHVIYAMNAEIFRITAGSTIPTIGMPDVKRMNMPLPPLDEQLMIVEFLVVERERFATLIAEAQRAIELLQERRTALISAAVNGKIDVREAATVGAAT